MPSDPLILGFDTSAAHVAAALLSGDQVLAQTHTPMRKGQAETLFPALDKLLTGAGKAYADLDAIAVGVGPGNFTGIRISVSAARGLALALDRPAIGVTGFAAVGLGATPSTICSLPAAAGRFYLGRADGSGTPVLWDGDNFDVPPQAILRHWPDDAVPEFAGATAQAQPIPVAEAICRAAAAQLASGQITPPKPYYLKPADAAPSKTPPVVILDDA